MPTPLRTLQTSGHSSFCVSNLPLWSLKSPSSRWLKSSFFICPRVSARFLHCFCTVSRDAMGTLTCKIRQRVQKLPGRKLRCFAQKWRKLESFKIRVFCPVGSFNQRARDSSSLERTKEKQTINRKKTRCKSWAFLFLYAENGPENATKTRQIRKDFRKQDLACRSKNPPTIFDVNSQKTGGLYSDDENFAGGHKKSAATLKHKMERSEILAG